MKQFPKIGILFIMPVFFLVFELLFKANYLYFYSAVFDPPYAYLFNGLNLARGGMELGHTDHPGTPLQMLIALVIRIVYFLRDSPLNLTDDVIINSELYLHVISTLLILFIAVMLFFTGVSVYRIRNNILTALFFQTSVFVSIPAIQYSSVVMTEPLYMFAELCLILLLVNYLFTPRVKQKEIWFAVLAGIITGFATAIKIILFPLIVIPLICFSTWRSRLISTGAMVISFVLFTLPALSKAERFFAFMTGIITHSGKYGKGPSGFYPDEFITNMMEVFSDNVFFTITIIVMFLTLVIFGFPPWNVFVKTDNKLYRMLAGIFVFCLLTCLMVSKHYSPHYMIPAHIFTVLSWFIMLSLYTPVIPGEVAGRAGNIVMSTAGIILFLRFVLWIVPRSAEEIHSLKTIGFVNEHVCDAPRIIVNQGEGGLAFKEQALYFGFAYSGNEKPFYARTLKKIYPHSYFYTPGRGDYYDWSGAYHPVDLFIRYDNMFVYLAKEDTGVLKQILKSTGKYGVHNLHPVRSHLLFFNKATGEVLYKMKIDNRALEKAFKVKNEVYCGFERLSEENGYLSSDSSIYFSKGNLQTEDIVFRGDHALKTDEEMQYGMGTEIPVLPGEWYKFSVWRNSSSASGVLVFSGKGGGFYRAGGSIQETRGEWERIEYTLEIPQNFNSDTLKFYLWNQLQDTAVYFDEFVLQWLE